MIVAVASHCFVIAVASTGCGRPPLAQPVPLTTDVVEYGLGAAEVGRDPRPIARTLFEDAGPDQLLLNLGRGAQRPELAEAKAYLTN